MDNGSPRNDLSLATGRRQGRQPVAELARRDDLRLGTALVRPSLLRVEGPVGQANVEPLVMRVLMAFADSGGVVLTRDELMRTCWTGTIVGDDAINRTIAEIRRIARATGAGFSIETISRVGYRLTDGSAVSAAAATQAGEAPGATPEASRAAEPVQTVAAVASPARRWLLIGGIASAGASAIAIALKPWRSRDGSANDSLVAAAVHELRQEQKPNRDHAVSLLTDAIARDTGTAAAHGMLALTHAFRAEAGEPDGLQGARDSIRAAREIEPDEINAEVAHILINRGPEDWFTTERRLRAALARDPGHVLARETLASQLQSGGYVRQSWLESQQIAVLDEQAQRSYPGTSFRHATRLWIRGDNRQALEAINRAAFEHQQHRAVWSMQLMLHALAVEQKDVALRMLDAPMAAAVLRPSSIEAWRLALAALEAAPAADHSAARAAIWRETTAPGKAMSYVHGVLILSELEQLDTAFALLAHRYGDFAVAHDSHEATMTDTGGHSPQWRQLQFLFTPSMAKARRHGKFAALADAMGLTQYWKDRGNGPDAGLI